MYYIGHICLNCLCFRPICSHLRNFISVSVSLSPVSLSVGLLFICYFSSYLGDQLRWAFAFLVACHYIIFLFHLDVFCAKLVKLIDRLIDWLIGNKRTNATDTDNARSVKLWLLCFAGNIHRNGWVTARKAWRTYRNTSGSTASTG